MYQGDVTEACRKLCGFTSCFQPRAPFEETEGRGLSVWSRYPNRDPIDLSILSFCANRRLGLAVERREIFHHSTRISTDCDDRGDMGPLRIKSRENLDLATTVPDKEERKRLRRARVEQAAAAQDNNGMETSRDHEETAACSLSRQQVGAERCERRPLIPSTVVP